MPIPSSQERTVSRAPAVSRVFTQWTVDDIEIAEALTNSGSLQRAADLCWALMADGRVRGALETRVRGLLRLPLQWEEAGDKRSSGRVAKALQGGDFYAAHSEAALFSLCTWGILLGVGVAQRVWELRDGRWLGVLRPYDARYLRWDAQKHMWMVRTEQSEVQIVPGDRRWVLYAPSCSVGADGDERPWMYGAWRACARPWLGKYLAWGDWNHHAEMHGSPIRTADVSLEKPPAAPVRDDFCDAFADIGGDTAIVPPPGITPKLLEATANTWQMFPGIMDAASREVVIAITGQASSTEVQQGQETGATLHGQVRQDLIDADAKTLSTCLREGCIRDYAAINFGTHELAPWPAWQTTAPKNAAARGAAMKALGDGIAALDKYAPEGQRIDRKALFEEAGIALEKIPQDAAPAAQPTQPTSPSQDPPPPTEAGQTAP